MSRLRTIVTLSRPARLPTVWSNCLAGWWLGGGGNAEQLPFVFGGATLLYLGGACLNDAFDADHDREHQPTRPIPSGAVSRQTVWRWALGLLVAGAVLLMWAGRATGIAGLVLVVSIILYNTLHRWVPFSPALKGLCRFLLYLIGASVATYGITGWALWCGLALWCYVAGIGCFARWLETPAKTQSWPAALLAVPVLLAVIMDADGYRVPGLLLAALLVLWCLRALRQTFFNAKPNLPKAIAGLVAGIVFVDWLAACPVPTLEGQPNPAARELSFVFIGLLLATFLLQRTTTGRQEPGMLAPP
jgi:hypothetical protein